jgi:hypothetical protein
MNSATSTREAYQQARVNVWRCADIELRIGPESSDPLVQTALEAVLAWLRVDVPTPGMLLQSYIQPHGPLRRQLCLVSSLLESDDSGEWPTRLCWWVVKTAYYRRWLELMSQSLASPSVE